MVLTNTEARVKRLRKKGECGGSLQGKQAPCPRTRQATTPRRERENVAQDANHGGEPGDMNDSQTPRGHTHDNDPRPLTSYAGIMASYGVLTGGLILLLRRKQFRLR